MHDKIKLKLDYENYRDEKCVAETAWMTRANENYMNKNYTKWKYTNKTYTNEKCERYTKPKKTNEYTN